MGKISADDKISVVNLKREKKDDDRRNFSINFNLDGGRKVDFIEC